MAACLVVGLASSEQEKPGGTSDVYVGNTGSAINVDGSRTGTTGPERRNPSRGPRIQSPDGSLIVFDAKKPRSRLAIELEQCLPDWEQSRSCYRAVSDLETPPSPPKASEDIAGTPAITITDVASFKPAGALVSAEPNNLGIAGLPINFVAPASAQEVVGTIFDLRVSVRFTPVAFDFHTGDGTVVTSATGGATWEHLGLPQFSPTPTSHTYRERGTYDAHVETHYSAEVNLGTGWIMLSGTVINVGPIQQIRIFEAHTALVAHTCLETPTAPGC